MAGGPVHEAIVVCGLGSLGQTCLRRLVNFRVPLWGVDLAPPTWEPPELERVLDGRLVLGDMRSPPILDLAGVRKARAVLLVSSSSSVNFEAALQVRLLNPTAQIVVRSTATAQAPLGALLERRLPGIAVVDPFLLTASAVAQALAPTGHEATFLADGEIFEVFHSPAVEGRESAAVDSRLIRAVHLPPESRWTRPPQGQTFLALRGFRDGPVPSARPRRNLALRRRLDGLVQRLSQIRPRARAWWQQRPRLLTLPTALILTMLLVGVASFSGREGWKQGLFVTLALLKGEYVDPVNLVLHQESIASVDEKVIAITLLYSLIGTLLTSALVAVILDRLLRDRLGLAPHPRLGRGGPWIALVGGGSLAGAVAEALRRERRGVVQVDPRSGPLEPILKRLPTSRLEAIALLSEDLLTNLQTALALEERQPEIHVVILAHAVGTAEPLGELLGGITVVSIMDVAADAVVATAFGERVEGVLRINHSNLLLVRYWVEEGDTLNGRSLSRIARGYGVTVLTIRHGSGQESRSFPDPEIRAMAGDQMMVLADLAGLRRVELCLAEPPSCRLRLQCQLPAEAHFEVRQCLARFFGLPPGATARWLDGAEHCTEPIDGDLAVRLRQQLHRLGVSCRIESRQEGTP
ncbi:MAG: NAD-binding protein [Synechococcus sp.]|nr:NAD-binding protein [Synechococcus sp.]